MLQIIPTRRINLYGGPGSGKSTTAAWLFAALKDKGLHVELVNEYVKSWAHTGRKVSGFDQLYLLGKQIHYEDRLLKNGVDLIVTDSPIWLSPFYASLYSEVNIVKPLMEICREFDSCYSGMDIFLNREGRPYNPKGRYQSEDESKDIDKKLIEFLRSNKYNSSYEPKSFKNDEREALLDWVENSVNLVPRSGIVRITYISNEETIMKSDLGEAGRRSGYIDFAGNWHDDGKIS